LRLYIGRGGAAPWRDGLEIFFASNRPGSVSAIVTDVWVSTRPSTSDPWSEPVNLGVVINAAGLEARPALSFDGRSLYFFSDRHGGFGSTDLFVSTRRKVGDDPE
jgi:WD40-like Beta Propeller Repeat